MKIIELATDELIPYENNPRNNDAAVKAVAESIKQFGFKVPIVIDKDNVIVAGHTRLRAAELLRLDTVPVIKADDLSEDQVRAFRLADNKTAELADWDMEKLNLELAQLSDFDMAAFGFDELNDTDDVQEPDDDPDAMADKIEEPTTQLGEIYQLGRHRLICGDSTDKDVLAKLMDGEEADLLLTDPPYNVALGQNGGHAIRPSEAKQLHRRTDGLTIDNDSWETDEEFVKFLVSAFRAALGVIKAGAAFYVWYADTQAMNFRCAAEKAGMQVRQNLIWVKSNFALGRQDYQWQHEPCLYGWKDGAGHYFTDSRTESTVIEDRININKLSKDEMKALLKELLADKQSTTVIHEDKPSKSVEHPTMKPLKLLARQIRNSTRKGEKVLDTFGGSGSTLLTCEQLGRTCYTVELDPKYCDVIIQRWEQATGNKAVRIDGATK